MTVENVFAAMLCFMSTCDNNWGNIQVNSVNPEPLKLWDSNCRNEAHNLNIKISELFGWLEEGNELLNTINKDLTNLNVTVGLSKDQVNDRKKRETVRTFDILTHPQFECRSSGNFMKTSNTELLPIGIQCASKQYGVDWILLATLDADQRNKLYKKSTIDFVNGFGRFVNGEIINEYFIGLQRLHEITAKSGRHELLILTLNGEETHTESVHYRNFSVAGANNDYKLQTLDGYDGSLIDPFQALLGEPFSITMFCMEQTGVLTMFVRSVSAN